MIGAFDHWSVIFNYSIDTDPPIVFYFFIIIFFYNDPLIDYEIFFWMSSGPLFGLQIQFWGFSGPMESEHQYQIQRPMCIISMNQNGENHHLLMNRFSSVRKSSL